MPFNRLENVSTANPMPVQEVGGTYNAKEHISASNPLPVMEVEGGVYSNYESVSEANPQPVAIIADSGAYTRYEDPSDTNAFPVKFIVGQSYDPRFDVSETNPWPVVVVSGGGEEYEGPLDIVAGAFVAYSQRALSAAMRGEALYTIREDGGNTTQTFSSDATTGEAPVASINTFLNGANGFVTTWKDQAGNGVDVSTAVAGEQAHWIASAINSKPSLRGRTTTLTNMFSALNVDWSAGNAVTIFSLQSSELGVLGAPVLGLYSADVSTGFELYSSGPALDVDYFGTGGYVEWDIDGTRSGFKILEATISAAGAVKIYVNGEEQAVSASGGADFPLEAITGGQIIVSLAQQAAIPPEGAFSKSTEHLMYASLLSAPQRLAIRQNLATYYGITLP